MSVPGGTTHSDEANASHTVCHLLKQERMSQTVPLGVILACER
jgi:hypothetical protein